MMWLLSLPKWWTLESICDLFSLLICTCLCTKTLVIVLDDFIKEIKYLSL